VNIVNREAEDIQRVTAADIQRVARQVFREENSSVMYYRAKA
jgi:predicted Zn-dependent peptidase